MATSPRSERQPLDMMADERPASTAGTNGILFWGYLGATIVTLLLLAIPLVAIALVLKAPFWMVLAELLRKGLGR